MMKQVLLIGDSIRMGYCETVRNLLSEKAEVLYPSDNCRSSTFIRSSLYAWAPLCDADRTAVVHFGCGQWDAAHFDYDPEPLVSIEEYARNLRSIVMHLREFFPHAKLIFATTTPMNPVNCETRNPRTTEDIRRYNEIATAVMKELKVEIDDLFAAALPWGSEAYVDYAHFTPEYFGKLGELVAGCIEKYV